MKCFQLTMCIGILLVGGVISAAPAGPDDVILVVPKDSGGAMALARDAGGPLLATSTTREVRAATRAALGDEIPEGVWVIRPAEEKLNLAHGMVSTAPGAEVRSLKAEDRNLQIVQFKAPIDGAQRRELENLGCSIISPIPSFGWLVWTDNPKAFVTALDRSSLEPMVQFRGDFRPDYTMSRSLDRDRATDKLVPIEVSLYDAPGATEASVEWIFAQNDFLIEAYTAATPDAKSARVSLQAPGHRVAEIAALPTVLSIQGVQPVELAGESQGLILAGETKLVSGREVPKTPADDGASYHSWLTTKMGALSGFDATAPNNYPIAVVVDSGVDNGGNTANALVPSPNSKDLRQAGSSTGASRIAFSFRWDNTGNKAEFDSDQNTGNHGHSVASILGGFNTATGSLNEHTTGLQYGLGINPWARMGSAKIDLSSTGSGSSFAPNKLEALITEYFTQIAAANDAFAAANPSLYVERFAISNNSWFTITPESNQCASGVFNPLNITPYSYDEYCRAADKRTRDSQVAVSGNQQTLLVFAAGNSGRTLPMTIASGTVSPAKCRTFNYDACLPLSCESVVAENSIFTPNLAKNVLTVGGSEDWDPRCPGAMPPAGVPCTYCCRRLGTAPNGEYHAQGWQGRGEADDDANDVWTESSRGITPGRTALGAPTSRVKPDLVAPARWVYANAYNSTVPAAEDCTSFDNTFGLDLNRFVPNSDSANFQAYERVWGTSFAAPAVSAAASLSVPFLRLQHGITAPTPALLKAYLVNSTTFLTGNNSYPEVGGELPNAWQGFGRLSLAEALKVQPRFIINESVDLYETDNQWRVRWTKSIANSGLPTRITLAYQDPPPATPQSNPYGLLLNNVDLTVRLTYTPSGGGTYSAYFLGNAFDATQRCVSRVLYPASTAQTTEPDAKLWGDGDRYNNVESIIIPALPVGATGASLRIAVSLKQITTNGVVFDEPSNDPPQNFALVASNVQ